LYRFSDSIVGRAELGLWGLKAGVGFEF
jgi:hypothetical protein